MGLATAEAFAKAGAAVVLADKEEALRTAARLADRGHKAIAVGCDVSDDAQVAGMVERAVAQFGQLDAAMPASRPASSRQHARGLGPRNRDQLARSLELHEACIADGAAGGSGGNNASVGALTGNHWLLHRLQARSRRGRLHLNTSGRESV